MKLKLPGSFPEWVFTVGAVAFSLSLIPTLVDSTSYVPWQSSALTAFFLTLYVPAFWKLGQKYPAVTGAVTATLWWLILWLRSTPPA